MSSNAFNMGKAGLQIKKSPVAILQLDTKI